MSRRYTFQKGFALPTVVIATVVLMMVLVTSVTAVLSTRVALDAQYQEQLLRDAAEAGVARASDCLAAYNYSTTWTSVSRLRPNTNCTGGAACTNLPKCFVVNTGQYRTSYEITPSTGSGTGIQEFNVIASISLLRASSGAVSKTVTKTTRTQIGAQVTNTSVVFGYTISGMGGAYYATIGRDGVMRAAGLNEYGQLGNGTTTNGLNLGVFAAPTTSPIVAGYANFLSVGFQLFAVDSTGKAFGAGQNTSGQLGRGGLPSATVTTPVQVAMPGGRPVSTVIVGGATNYFLATDGNLYAAGECDFGRLGSNYTIAGCTDQSTPVRVNLPIPNGSDPNTIPTKNIVSDRYTAYVRMAGGRVYGWGDNNMGQLGYTPLTARSNPIQIGTYGNPGQPKATQILNDGVNVYIVDDYGHLNSVGDADFGNHGNRYFSLLNTNTNRCMENTNGDGLTMAINACSNLPRQRFEYRTNGSVYNEATNKCLDNTSSDGINLRLFTCNGSAAQTFTWDPNANTLMLPSLSKCLDNPGGAGVLLRLANCSTSVTQNFAMFTSWLTRFDMTGISGSVASASTDQRHVTILTSEGEVWSAGVNSSGMFGGGTSNMYQPDPVKFQLPVGVYGKSVYATNVSTPNDYQYQNLMVVGTNGRVYGAGANSYGQLGNGTVSTRSLTPVTMSTFDGTTLAAKEVAIGYGTTVIYTVNGTVYTVGNNNRGQLGDGTTNNRSTPYFSQLINQSDPTQY